MAHARYLARHFNPADGSPIRLNEEDPALPGYSEAGSKAAKASAIDFQDPLSAARARMGSLSGRLRILDPELRRIGVGYARGPRGKWFSVLDWTTGRGQEGSWVVLYPVDRQENVPLAFPDGEVPDPIPEATSKVAGYPITATFSPEQSVKRVEARLTDGDERAVEVWFSSPEKPANSRYAASQGNTVCLIAKDPLEPNAAYTVTISAEVDGKPWTRKWSFSTLETHDQKEAVRKALELLNTYRKGVGFPPLTLDPERSEGCAAHARYLAKNVSARMRRELDLRKEAPDLPGYSPKGRKAARAATALIRPDLVAAVEWYAGSYLGRSVLLDPLLGEVGLGVAVDARREWVVVLDCSRPPKSARNVPVVVFPYDKQTNVPLEAVDETPSPIPAGGRGKPAGYAITAGFPFGAQVSDVRVLLTDAAGERAEGWLSTPPAPANPGFPQNTICFVPKTPLKPNTTYSVKMTARVQGKLWSQDWTFRTTSRNEPEREAVLTKVLEFVNAYRKVVGLGPVTIDPLLSEGCEAHAKYLVANFKHPSTEGLGMHDEHPDRPGYTEKGRRAGKASVIHAVKNPPDSVSGWMATLYHRVPIMRPELKRIGFGYARLPNGLWQCVMDTNSGTSSDQVVCYPADGQKDVPLTFSVQYPELRDLVPEAADGAAGYPITVAFPHYATITKVAAELTDGSGARVAFWLLAPESAGEMHWRRSVICLLPVRPLKPATAYTVKVSARVNGRPMERFRVFTTNTAR